MTTNGRRGLHAVWDDVWLLGGVRTPFVDYSGALGLVSPIDLGIKVAREVLSKSGVSPDDVGTVIAGSVAQASFDAYMLPRHIGLYARVPTHVPAHLVQRVCGTGLEAISQAADAIALGRVDVGLCVGSESMSRNPVAAYTHRSGFRLGQVEFKDFLWEALLDPAPGVTMGGTAETLASRYGISREEVDEFAATSFERALCAQAAGFFDGEIVPVATETFEVNGYHPRGIHLPRDVPVVATDTHVRPSPRATLARLRPAFGGVQTGGNSSGVVDGAAAAVVGSRGAMSGRDRRPLARVAAVVTVGVPPEVMGIGPAPAIRSLLDVTGLSLGDIDRFEINEAFGAQIVAVERELGLDRSRLNVNGGAIAIGHPLAATGVRLAVTLARELQRGRLRYGIASACIGGGQGIALLLERQPDQPLEH
jgi:acetyl-CoA C-acetyltransferase